MNIAWYAARLRRMGARELASRLRDEGLKTRWRRLQGRPAPVSAPILETGPAMDRVEAAPAIGDPILAEADALLAGRLRILGRDTALPLSEADLVPRSRHRHRDPPRGLCLRHRGARPGRHRQSQIPARAEPSAACDPARRGLLLDRPRSLCGTCRHAAPLLVERQSLSDRDPLVERHRGRAPSRQLLLGAPPPRRLAGSRRLLRKIRSGPRSDLSPPPISGAAAQPRLIGQ